MTFSKGNRQAHLVLRSHPIGIELMCRDRGELLWSKMIHSTDPPSSLDDDLEAALAACIARGWRRVDQD
jgi:hypothetical protein